jgi:hypothetical protein
MTTATRTLFNLSIATGTAPEGSVIEEWDWNEDEDGFRYRTYWTCIPTEAVTPDDDEPWKLTEISAEYALAVVKHAATIPNGVAQVTLSTEDGRSFMATTWHEASYILTIVQDFLDAVA